MERIVELIGAMVLLFAGALAGRSLGRGRGWWVGFAGSLLAVGMVVVGHRSAMWSVRPPFSWAVSQTFEPLLMALCVPLMLSTLIVRLAAKR